MKQQNSVEATLANYENPERFTQHATDAIMTNYDACFEKNSPMSCDEDLRCSVFTSNCIHWQEHSLPFPPQNCLLLWTGRHYKQMLKKDVWSTLVHMSPSGQNQKEWTELYLVNRIHWELLKAFFFSSIVGKGNGKTLKCQPRKSRSKARKTSWSHCSVLVWRYFLVWVWVFFHCLIWDETMKILFILLVPTLKH